MKLIMFYYNPICFNFLKDFKSNIFTAIIGDLKVLEISLL